MSTTNEQYDKAVLSCQQIFLNKTKDYGTSWRVYRIISVADQIYIKAKRILTIQEIGQQKIDDDRISEFKGILNYGVIGLIQLDINNDEVEVYVGGVLKTITTDYFIRKESKKLVFNTAPAANSEVKVIYTNFDIALLKNRQVTGVTSGATAIVEKSVKRIITDRLNLGFPFELFISDKTLVGTFSGGEEIQTTIIDDN